MLIGAIIFVAGTLLHFAPWAVNWFGKLPGDINIENENQKIFIPITSMIIISVVLTLIINLFKR